MSFWFALREAVWPAMVCLLLVAAAGLAAVIRARKMQRWLGPYLYAGATRERPRPGCAPRIFIAVCDHFEPDVGKPSRAAAREKVERWRRCYPELFARFGDSRGQVPQHTFFYPQDEYNREYVARVAELCRDGFGDVEVHLHHDNDSPEGLREKLCGFREELVREHGLLRTDPSTGETVYGFIHGNWALCNSRPDGRWCGVDNELTILRETGCYADFTMPSAPSDTQTRMVNRIYYAADRAGRSRSHEWGARARKGVAPPADSLLMIQGPLGFDWSRLKCGLVPRIENGDLHAGRPPAIERLALWQRAGVCVAGRPDWQFVKLHTHGCKNGNIDVLLGEPYERFHADLAIHARQQGFEYYYVTAWEMAQLVHQAERGLQEPEFPIRAATGAAHGRSGKTTSDRLDLSACR